MNVRIIQTIIKKDLKEALQNKGILVPAIVAPMLFMILLPLAIILVPSYFITSGSAAQMPPDMDFQQVLTFVKPFLGPALEGYNEQQAWIVLATGYMLAPFLLMMPLMISTIIGAESFVGEKERKTLEALIYTPASDAELFTGKVLASVIPAVLLTWVCFIIYGITVNAAAWPVMGRIWFPLVTWWPLMLWLAPAIATLGMGFTVLIDLHSRQ